MSRRLPELRMHEDSGLYWRCFNLRSLAVIHEQKAQQAESLARTARTLANSSRESYLAALEEYEGHATIFDILDPDDRPKEYP